MNKLSFSGIALAVLVASSAMAADMGAPMRPLPAPVLSWTGYYIGIDLGWDDVRQTATTTPYPQPGFGGVPIIGTGVTGFGSLSTNHPLDRSGFLGGIHVGYNLQKANWVFGMEGDAMWLNYNKTDVETVLATPVATMVPTFSMQVSARNQWLASARGRLGWTNGPWMIYGTAGLAITNSSYTATATALPAALLPGIGAYVSFWEPKPGYVVGGGVEWMLTPNWLLRAEYLHYGFGSANSDLPLVFNTPAGTCAPAACYWNVDSGSQYIDTVRVGLSYKL